MVYGSEVKYFFALQRYIPDVSNVGDISIDPKKTYKCSAAIFDSKSINIYSKFLVPCQKKKKRKKEKVNDLYSLCMQAIILLVLIVMLRRQKPAIIDIPIVVLSCDSDVQLTINMNLSRH